MRLIDHALRLAGHSCGFIAETLWPAPQDPSPANPHTDSTRAACDEGPEGDRGNLAAAPSGQPTCTCPCINCSNQAHWMCHGEGVEIDTVYDEPPLSADEIVAIRQLIEERFGDQTIPAGVDGSTPPPAGADWLGWAVPAIYSVLAEHRFRHADHSSIGSKPHCSCGHRPSDAYMWRGHVAPIIAERIGCVPAKAIAALQSFQPK